MGWMWVFQAWLEAGWLGTALGWHGAQTQGSRYSRKGSRAGGAEYHWGKEPAGLTFPVPRSHQRPWAHFLSLSTEMGFRPWGEPLLPCHLLLPLHPGCGLVGLSCGHRCPP